MQRIRDIKNGIDSGGTGATERIKSARNGFHPWSCEFQMSSVLLLSVDELRIVSVVAGINEIRGRRHLLGAALGSI
jgi:hypothetical protein